MSDFIILKTSNTPNVAILRSTIQFVDEENGSVRIHHELDNAMTITRVDDSFDEFVTQLTGRGV